MPATVVDAADRLAGMADRLIELAGMLKLAQQANPVPLSAHIIGRANEAADTLVDVSRMLLEGQDQFRAEHARAWTEWLHQIASPVNGIVGWLTVLHRVGDERLWDRAASQIDRNVETLTRVLKQPPGRPDAGGSAEAEQSIGVRPQRSESDAAATLTKRSASRRSSPAPGAESTSSPKPTVRPARR